MRQTLKRSIMTCLILAGLLCGVYPALVTLFSQALFPRYANGSLIKVGDKIVGSELIGQNFSKPEYFHGRPSAAGNGYDPTASSGSNLGPTSQKLMDRLKADIDHTLKENPSAVKGEIPVDLITASGSGLDPHLSPDAAILQANRISQARGLENTIVKKLISENTENPTFGFLGDSRVNVLQLNQALDALK